MPVEVILPRVDMDMTEGRIARWHAGEGDTVALGQPLFDIETDKAAMEIEAPAAGVLRGIRAAAETAVAVGSVIGWICRPGEPAGAVPDAPASAPVSEAAPALPPAPPAAAPRNAVAATPLARRLARQQGVALAGIRGSGPRGRVQARDVRALAVRDLAGPAEPAAVPASGTLHGAWLRQGSGRPLVLVHGFGAELDGWRPLVASLDPGRPVFAVDLPGHGRSPPGTPSLAAIAGALADTLAAEGIGSADLIGHSLGAAVAATLAEAARLDLRSLILLSPAGLGPDIDGAFLSGFLRARSAASLAPWLRLLVADEAALTPGFVAATARARATASGAAAAAAQMALADALFPDGTQAFSIRPILARLDLPLRVVFGTADRIIPARHARGLPGSVALHLFEAVGHMPHVEIRPALARLIAQQVAG